MIDTKMIRIGMWWADDKPNPERAAATIHELCDELDAAHEALKSMTNDRDHMVNCHNSAIQKLHDERNVSASLREQSNRFSARLGIANNECTCNGKTW